MYRLPRLLCVAATLTLAVVHVNEAQARRCHRSRCAPCCNRDCGGHYGDNYTCVLYKVYEIAPNDFLYYANFYEGSCGVEPQGVYAEGDWGDNPLQNCPDECIPTTRKSQHYGSDDMQRLEHYTKKVFSGFDPALPATYAPTWAAGVTQVGAPVYKRIHFAKEGRIYKAKVFELSLSGNLTIYVAFEIADFPTGEHPGTIGSASAKKCAGQHAYSLKQNGKGMLFFADVNG